MKGWETQTRIECRPADFTAHPTLDYVFRMRGSYFLHVVMQCNNRPVTAGLVDEFQLLIDHVEHCAKQEYHERFLLADEPSHLFEDLILRRPVGKGELARRAGALELPSEGSFVLLALYFSEGGSESQFLAYHAQHAKEAFPHCFVGVHGLYVLVLDASGNAPESLAPPVQAFANAHPCTVGASEAFSSLQDFAFAFQQAKKAVEMAMGLRPSLAARYEEKPSAPSVHRFGDCLRRLRGRSRKGEQPPGGAQRPQRHRPARRPLRRAARHRRCAPSVLLPQKRAQRAHHLRGAVPSTAPPCFTA